MFLMRHRRTGGTRCSHLERTGMPVRRQLVTNPGHLWRRSSVETSQCWHADCEFPGNESFNRRAGRSLVAEIWHRLRCGADSGARDRAGGDRARRRRCRGCRRGLSGHSGMLGGGPLHGARGTLCCWQRLERGGLRDRGVRRAGWNRRVHGAASCDRRSGCAMSGRSGTAGSTEVTGADVVVGPGGGRGDVSRAWSSSHPSSSSSRIQGRNSEMLRMHGEVRQRRAPSSASTS